jgi:hypothetical protein
MAVVIGFEEGVKRLAGEMAEQVTAISVAVTLGQRKITMMSVAADAQILKI